MFRSPAVPAASVAPAARQIAPDDPALAAVLSLIRAAFAYMEGRIDPPSSMHALTFDRLARQAVEGEVWAVEEMGRVIACVVLTPRPPVLYLGKLAVAPAHRGRGLARALVRVAEGRAEALGLRAVELQSRVELTENHAAFSAMGFVMAAETAHPGFDRATALTFLKPLGQAQGLP
jgi:predicted N-acetyltransferase YhbS